MLLFENWQNNLDFDDDQQERVVMEIVADNELKVASLSFVLLRIAIERKE